MATYKTPDVYVEEVSLFPPSVAEVATAIPAFIGYTKKCDYRGHDLTDHPVKISSQMEYHERFGKGPELGITSVNLDANNITESVERNNSFNLYDSLLMFFANGGGTCYIVSVGTYEAPEAKKDDLLRGLEAVGKVDEVTLLLFPDAIALKDGLYAVQQAALAQCADLMDRFVIMDVIEDADDDSGLKWENGIQQFRDKIGINYLKYAAAYTPHIIADLDKEISYRDVKGCFQKNGEPVELIAIDTRPIVCQIVGNIEKSLTDIDNTDPNGEVIKKCHKSKKATHLRDDYLEVLSKHKTDAEKFSAGVDYIRDVVLVIASQWGHAEEGILSDEMSQYVRDKSTAYLSGFFAGVLAEDLEVQRQATVSAMSVATFDKTVNTLFDDIKKTANPEKLVDEVSKQFGQLLETIRDIWKTAESNYHNRERILINHCPVYENIINKIQKIVQTVPPSGAIAGVYASVDRDRGVWKAPANISLNNVLGITKHIGNREQEDLNVDVTAGKSINAIRPFKGKGVLVWGSRTLMGNDNEWRYVPVRRFFNMVEESIKLSTYWAVFEPNTANLWVKVKAMIENYLIEKWKEGALAGAKPEDAFYVNIGLGTTMTAMDILEGRLIVDIGMAVVRPAEFIVLRFMHKMQES